MILDIT